MRILLASASERRREWLLSLLEDEKISFHSRGLSADEAVAPSFLDVGEKAEFTCMAKATSASEEQSLLNQEASEAGGFFDMVIVSDTLVEDPEDHLLAMGKPADGADAVAMLLRLSGRRHRVWSSSAKRCQTERRHVHRELGRCRGAPHLRIPRARRVRSWY